MLSVRDIATANDSMSYYSKESVSAQTEAI